eukprot:gene6287-7538_t
MPEERSKRTRLPRVLGQISLLSKESLTTKTWEHVVTRSNGPNPLEHGTIIGVHQQWTCKAPGLHVETRPQRIQNTLKHHHLTPTDYTSLQRAVGPSGMELLHKELELDITEPKWSELEDAENIALPLVGRTGLKEAVATWGEPTTAYAASIDPTERKLIGNGKKKHTRSRDLNVTLLAEGNQQITEQFDANTFGAVSMQEVNSRVKKKPNRYHQHSPCGYTSKAQGDEPAIGGKRTQSAKTYLQPSRRMEKPLEVAPNPLVGSVADWLNAYGKPTDGICNHMQHSK